MKFSYSVKATCHLANVSNTQSQSHGLVYEQLFLLPFIACKAVSVTR